MKAADIEVGKEYVYGRTAWPGEKRDRVLILGKDVTDPGGRNKWDYKLQANRPVIHKLWGQVFRGYNDYADTRGSEAIQPGQVIELWSEHQARLDEKKTVADRQREELERVRDECMGPSRFLAARINSVAGTRIEVRALQVAGAGADAIWDVFAHISEEDLALLARCIEELRGARDSTDLLDRMQAPEVRAATRRAFSASPEELSGAAVAAAQKVPDA